jgi:alanyl-tRNA synthetase
MDDIKATVKSVYHKSQFLTSTKDVPAGESFGILLDKTNFYAEQGGQEYDTGVLAIDGKAEFKVEDVQVANGYVLHIGRMVEGEIDVGEEVIATYDEVRPTPSLPLDHSSRIAPPLAHPQQSHRYPHPQLCPARSPRQPH